MRPPIVVLPAQKQKAPERALDKMLEHSLKHAFPNKHMMRHSQTDKTHSTGRGYNIGEPDYVGHIMGVYVAIENKVHPNSPTDEQLRWLKTINATGGLGFLLVQDRDGSYYLMLPPEAWEFSWRRKEGWLPIPCIQFPGQPPILQLDLLAHLVRGQFMKLHSEVFRG